MYKACLLLIPGSPVGRLTLLNHDKMRRRLLAAPYNVPLHNGSRVSSGNQVKRSVMVYDEPARCKEARDLNTFLEMELMSHDPDLIGSFARCVCEMHSD
jgi:hypothetical protein